MATLMPFTVRTEDGRESAHYVESAAVAATRAEIHCGSPAVLVIRADEPFLRKRSWLRRAIDRWVP